MHIKKMNFADAILVGPGVNVEEVLDLFGPYKPDNERCSFHIRPTKGGNRVLIPMFYAGNLGEIHFKMRVVDKQFQWPILPLIEHRGGYMTATARTYMEFGWPYEDIGGNLIWRKGKYVRTRHRVMYADRTKGCLVVDVLLRPQYKDNLEEKA